MTGLLLDALGVTGGRDVLVAALGLLTLACFPFFFYFSGPVGPNPRRLVFTGFAGLMFSMVPLGLLGKVLSQAWGGQVLLAGTLAAVAVLAVIPGLSRQDSQAPPGFYRALLLRALLLAVYGGTFSAL